MVLVDWQIARLCEDTSRPMIEPFKSTAIKEVDGIGVVSFGLSSAGYDIRVADEFEISSNYSEGAHVVDPKGFKPEMLTSIKGDNCIIPPNSFALARTMEYFRIPRGILTLCVGKSTYARCGIIVNVTPFEPEWEGFATLEISNTTPMPAKIYAGEGIAQVLFLETSARCDVSYADKKGKYQGQVGITRPKV